jgi:tRNA modification GTPase
MNQTIVALATPWGRSGIGIVRLSGDDSLPIAQKLVKDKNFNPQPRRSILKKIYEIETGELIDEAIITYFQSPQSFTGEDVIEIASHGSPVILRQIIDNCLKLDARLAEAGEFSLRALMHGRMNLSQAEAIRDLIDAQTLASARQSIRQLRGEFSNQLQPLKDKLLNVIVVLESTLEFVEDDLPDYQNEQIQINLREIAHELNKLAATFRAGKLLREGLKVAFVGRPNVGKSSIFNALLGHERAIVTDIAGTTRDALHEKLVIQNIPISLIDTAGLRQTSDTVESIGVERTKQTLADADLVVVVLDSSQDFTNEDEEILNSVKELNYIIVENKLDISNSKLQIPNSKLVKMSAKTGQGIEDLENAIIAPFQIEETNSSGFLVTDARHHDLLRRAKDDIENSIILLDQKMSEEIVLIGLHNAIRYLGEITGETTTEEILTRIFSTFCIGK